MPPSTTISAKRKLELSQISPHAVQREMMGTDVDMAKFALYLSSQVRVDLVDRIVDATISRSIEASSSLEVTVNDYDRDLLQSGLLSNKLDVQIDGLWFRLRSVDKMGDLITLKFEDREIAVLRNYAKWKIAKRSNVTRAQFVLNLIREVKEFTIPVVIPELSTIQPVERYTGDTSGIDQIINKNKGINIKSSDQGPPVWGSPVTGASGQVKSPPSLSNRLNIQAHTKPSSPLTVEGQTADSEQLINANIILAVGERMLKGHPRKRKLLVCAIMTAMTETRLHNNPGGDGTSAGVFQQTEQQDHHWGTYEDRVNVETSAGMFYRDEVKVDAANPNLSYNDLCANTQRPKAEYRNRYENFRTEADRFVDSYGVPGGDLAQSAAQANGQHSQLPSFGGKGGEFYYWRGTIYDRAGKKHRKAENSWSCIKRLADEVDWKFFFVSGTFYFMSEDDLLAQQPLLNLTEFLPGVKDISGSYDNNAKSATLTVQVEVGRWLIPPGAVVVVQDMGPWNGRWLVSEFQRSLFDLNATVMLTKANPALPEPLGGSQITGWPKTWFPQADPPRQSNVTKYPGNTFGTPTNQDGSRDAVVAAAEEALSEQLAGNKYHYLQSRPYPDTLYSAEAHAGIDCSAFAILCYKTAGVENDPSGHGFDGNGNTYDLYARGVSVSSPRPGDLILYVDSAGRAGHVAVYVGNGNVIEIGSEDGVKLIAYNYRTIIANGIRSYLP